MEEIFCVIRPGILPARFGRGPAPKAQYGPFQALNDDSDLPVGQIFEKNASAIVLPAIRSVIGKSPTPTPSVFCCT